MEQSQNKKYNKPAFWLIIIAACLLVVVLIIANALDLKGLFSSASNSSTNENSNLIPESIPEPTEPSISPNGGLFVSSQYVTLIPYSKEDTISYTTDGSVPSATNGTVYSVPFSINSTTTVAAVAYRSPELYSPVVSATFTKKRSSTSSGSGGSGGGSNANTYAGCEGRTTGFSSTTGKTCVGNTLLNSYVGCEDRNTGFSSVTGKSCVGNIITTTYYNFGPVTLRNGSTGEGVKELQRFLNAKLNLSLVVDGKLGPKTIAVIKAWQLNHGLVPDGLVGPKTKAMMNSGV